MIKSNFYKGPKKTEPRGVKIGAGDCVFWGGVGNVKLGKRETNWISGFWAVLRSVGLTPTSIVTISEIFLIWFFLYGGKGELYRDGARETRNRSSSASCQHDDLVPKATRVPFFYPTLSDSLDF